MREDIGLQAGTAAKSVTVTEQASLLKTETGELTHTVTLEQMDDLPLLGIGTTNAGATAIRNPFNAIEALPGLSVYNPGYGSAYNGQATQASIRIESQATPHALGYEVTAHQAWTPFRKRVSNRNYAPEFGPLCVLSGR